MAEQKKGECIHADHRSRMQKRVEREGLTSLAAHEVLEYLLFFAIPRKDTNALAHRLIQHFGGFCEVLEAS
ncbi:MAG: DNA repair protein RadC, partial [Gemmiger sp.]|nr:DNA repair protein RadC [Gemmiger sp.]